MFSQMVEVVVPLNSNIHAGDIIELSIPNITTSKRAGVMKSSKWTI